jgi:hypothetical protein
MTTTFAPIMLSVWAAFALVTVLLYAYRSSLTRDEEGQIFLDEAFAHEKAVQTRIVSSVAKLEPALRVSMALTVAMTIVVIAYYVWDAGKSFLG